MDNEVDPAAAAKLTAEEVAKRRGEVPSCVVASGERHRKHLLTRNWLSRGPEQAWHVACPAEGRSEHPKTLQAP